MTKTIALAVAAIVIGKSSIAQNLSYTLVTSGLDAVTFESGLTELEAGDVDGDGRIDLVTIGDHGSPNVNATEAGIMVWKSNGAGTDWSLVKQGNFGYGGVALGDVNNDGIMDIGYAMHHNYGSNDFGDQLIETALGEAPAHRGCRTMTDWQRVARPMGCLELISPTSITTDYSTSHPTPLAVATVFTSTRTMVTGVGPRHLPRMAATRISGANSATSIMMDILT